MALPENAAKQLDVLTNIMQNALSMELRVKSSEVDAIINNMEEYGFKYKNSWPSMELKDYTVLDFWKKELIKISTSSE